MPKAANSTPPPPGPPPGEASFEHSLAELETIVAHLEAGAKPLAESLALYEQGVAALKRCHTILDQAEKRIRLLVTGPTGAPALREGHAEPPSTPAKQKAPASENSPRAPVDASPKSGEDQPVSSPAKPEASGGKRKAGGLYE